MGDLWAFPRRLRRSAEPEHPFNSPTANLRLPLRCVMGSGGKQPVEGFSVRLRIHPVFILWPQVAIKTMHHLRHHVYNHDGWIRGRDDLRCQGEHQPPRRYKFD